MSGEVEQTVWSMLTEHAVDDLIDGTSLGKIAAPGPMKPVVDERMRANGWLADGTRGPRTALVRLSALGAALTIGGMWSPPPVHR